MSDFTPGPWEVRDRWYIRSIKADPLDGCHAEVKCCAFVPAEKKEEHEANARLIAQAPALFEEVARLRALLADLEWSAVSGYGDESCPSCCSPRGRGRHDSDCRLKAALEANKPC